MNHLDTLIVMFAFGFVDYYLLEELKLVCCKENFEKFAQIIILALVNFFIFGLIDTNFVANAYTLYFVTFVTVLLIGWVGSLVYGTLRHRPHIGKGDKFVDKAKATSDHLLAQLGKTTSEEEAIFGFPGKLSAYVFDYEGHFLAAGLVDDTPAQWNDDNFELLLEPFEEEAIEDEQALREALSGEAYRVYLDTQHKIKVYLKLEEKEEAQEEPQEEIQEKVDDKPAFGSKQDNYQPEVVEEVPAETEDKE